MNITSLLPWFWPRTRREAAREIALRPRQVWSAHLRAGRRVECRAGVVWLTLSDETSDHVLRAGQNFVAPQSGRVVVQALGETTATVQVREVASSHPSGI